MAPVASSSANRLCAPPLPNGVRSEEKTTVAPSGLIVGSRSSYRSDVRRSRRPPPVGEPEAIEVGVTGHGQAAEHDALAVRCPGGRQNGDELRKLVAADDFRFP